MKNKQQNFNLFEHLPQRKDDELDKLFETQELEQLLNSEVTYE